MPEAAQAAVVGGLVVRGEFRGFKVDTFNRKDGSGQWDRIAAVIVDGLEVYEVQFGDGQEASRVMRQPLTYRANGERGPDCEVPVAISVFQRAAGGSDFGLRFRR